MKYALFALTFLVSFSASAELTRWECHVNITTGKYPAQKFESEILKAEKTPLGDEWGTSVCNSNGKIEYCALLQGDRKAATMSIKDKASGAEGEIRYAALSPWLTSNASDGVGSFLFLRVANKEYVLVCSVLPPKI